MPHVDGNQAVCRKSNQKTTPKINMEEMKARIQKYEKSKKKSLKRYDLFAITKYNMHRQDRLNFLI